MSDLKTFNGLARANVKTFNPLASANWKTWNGLNTVVSGGGWWVVSGQTCVAAYQPKGAASLGGAYVSYPSNYGSYSNLANPGTNDAATGTAPSWSSGNGWEFVSAYSQNLTTGLVPADGWSMIVRFSNANTDQAQIRWMCGVDSSDDARFYLSPSFGFSNGRLYGGGGFSFAGTSIASGVMCIADSQPYLDGSTDGSALTNWGTSQSNAIRIGALTNTSNAIVYPWDGYIQAMAVYSTTLASGDVSSLTTAMNAL
jgi:hypothetical protein